MSDIRRRIVTVTPREPGGSTIRFECGHERISNRPADVIRKWFREYPCLVCASPLHSPQEVFNGEETSRQKAGRAIDEEKTVESEVDL